MPWLVFPGLTTLLRSFLQQPTAGEVTWWHTFCPLGWMPARDCQDPRELAGALTPLRKCFSECGLWINSLNITLDLDRNANSPAPPKTYWDSTEIVQQYQQSLIPLAWLSFFSLLLFRAPCFNSLGITSPNKTSPCLMLCVFGGTHAKQHLFHQCQDTSLLSHRSQSSLPYPLSQCTTHSPLILTSACIYFLQFVPSIQ